MAYRVSINTCDGQAGDEDDVGDDELDDDASIDEDFHAHYAEDDEYAGVRVLRPPLSRAPATSQRFRARSLRRPARPQHAYCMGECAETPACLAFVNSTVQSA